MGVGPHTRTHVDTLQKDAGAQSSSGLAVCVRMGMTGSNDGELVWWNDNKSEQQEKMMAKVGNGASTH